MNHAIFIRSYARDFAFLDLLLKSLVKYATGFDEIVVHVDDAERREATRMVAGRARVTSSMPLLARGYLNQQAIKHSADQFTAAQFITPIDSDCCATGPINPEHFQAHGLPQILVTPFDHLGNHVPWRPATEKAMQRPCEFETMRGMRLQTCRDTLRECREWMERVHRMPLASFIDRTPNYSEFNVIFNWALRFHRDRYSWLHTEKEPLPYHNLRQFFSGNGVTPEIRAEIDRYLA